MSGQFPGGYSSPVGGHMQGMISNTGSNFNPAMMQQQPTPQQQQQQQQQPANTTQQNPAAMNPGQSPSQAQVPPQIMPTTSGVGPQPIQGQMNPPSSTNITVPQLMGMTKLGQETVQDIISRFQEIFGTLKVVTPTGDREIVKNENFFRSIRLLFKRLRILYEKCNDGYPQGLCFANTGMEFTQVESLIPYMDEPETRQEPPQTEEYRKENHENAELKETVLLRNRQLREVIEKTRVIIWEINTMLIMRKS